MGKKLVVYSIYDGILFSHKKWENPAICNNIDGLSGIYVKWNMSDRERQRMCDLTYIWNQKKKRHKIKIWIYIYNENTENGIYVHKYTRNFFSSFYFFQR